MPKSSEPPFKSFIEPFRVEKGRSFRLRDIDPASTGGLGSEEKAKAREYLDRGSVALSNLQEKLYAQDRWAVLLVFQAMDAAGKDGTIKHVMSGVNAQGVQVYSFKAPSEEELDHDFLWRCMRNLPERGRIGIFNRSYYEEVLVVRVHREILDRQKLPPELVKKKNLFKERHKDIAAFERYLSRNGVLIRKFFLHLSKEEQRKRFLERLETPEKKWKFSIGDVRERDHWDEYMAAYEDTIRRTATKDAPWFVVPADNKWFTRLVVGAAIVDALHDLHLEFPAVDESKRKELDVVRRELLAEGRPKGRKRR